MELAKNGNCCVASENQIVVSTEIFHHWSVVVTKSDIAERIQNKLGISKKESQDLLESVLSLMKETLESGEQIKVAGFGNFEIKHKKDRKGRNPHTSETITIGARRVLTFKASAVLKQAINKTAMHNAH